MTNTLPDLPVVKEAKSRRKKSSVIIVTAMTLLLAFSVAATAFSMRTLFYDFDVRTVTIMEHGEAQTQGDRFDQALFDQIEVFEYIRSFDHVFRQGGVRTSLKNIHVDRCEVRQKDFQKFTQWQKLYRKQQFTSPAQPREWQYFSSNKNHTISGRPEAPANGVSYYDAYAYCKAARGRLPFGEEWAAFASGKAQRLYPWGDEFNASGWPYIDPLLNAAQRCQLHQETATPDGIYSLGDTVSEWAQNAKKPLQPTLHGGNAYNVPREIYSLNALYRYAPAEYRSPYVGFRCVYDKKPKRRTPWKVKYKTVQIEGGEYAAGIPDGARMPSLLVNLPPGKISLLKRLFRKDPRQQSDKVLFVMKHEATRKQYDAFLRDPLVHLGLYADENEPEGHDYRPRNWKQQIRHPELPVADIDWWSAHAFASWAGGRLPTADEWVAVASSRGRNIYPWGNEFSSGNAVTGEMKMTSAQTATMQRNDITADGILGMGGNVSEWTQSIDIADGGHIIVTKGGNYLLPGKETARIDFRNTIPPGYHSPTVGLRVVFDQRLLDWR